MISVLYLPETRDIPSAEEIEPWVTAIVDLWDNPEHYQAASAGPGRTVAAREDRAAIC